MSSRKVKILFLDSNIYINGIYQEQGGSIGLLKKILEKLDSEDIILIIPEVIKAEVLSDLEISHKNIINSITECFEKIELQRKSQTMQKFIVKESFLDKELKETMEYFLEKYNNYNKLINKTIHELFKHKNSRIIRLTQKLLLAGMKRAALKMPPFTLPASGKGVAPKSAHLRDMDCIAYESLRYFLTENKEFKGNSLIICTDDVDYYENKDGGNIYKCLKEENKNDCANLKIYADIAEMFKKELDISKPKNILEEVKIGSGGSVSPSLQSIGTPAVTRIRSYTASPSAWNDMMSQTSSLYSAKMISHSEEFCPVCFGRIKDYLSGFIIKREREYGITSWGWGVGSTNRFKCPFCETEFYVS